MKLKDIDKLSKGDVLVFTKWSGRTNHKEGHQIIFDSFYKHEITSASTIYCKDDGELLAFTPSICRFIDPLSKSREKN